MKNGYWIGLGLALGALPLLVSAASSQQEVDFNYSSTVPSPVSGEYLPNTFFTGTFNPFNPALGTLVSYTVDWSVSVSAQGVVGPGTAGGMGINLGGTYSFGNSGYSGNGNGGSNGGGPGSSFTITVPTIGDSKTFLPENAGVSYNPAILGLVNGGTPFALKWASPVTFSGPNNLASITPSVTGSVKLTYNYNAVPEPGEWAGAAGVAALGFAACRRWARRR